jgi:hypothetical protein
MTDTTPTLANPLQDAISQLRSIREDRDFPISAADAGSVERIAVHITNINASVTASSRDHVNASKRLNDFATALARIARNTTPPNEVLTDRIRLIGASLRGVSDRLAGTQDCTLGDYLFPDQGPC